mgnify:CR=1 FL=1
MSMEANVETLSQLKYIDKKDVNVCGITAYSIALEAWRKGIEVTFINRPSDKRANFFKLSYLDQTHFFHSSQGDLISQEAIDITSDYIKMRQYLQEAGLPVVSGKYFDKVETKDSVIADAVKLGFPLELNTIEKTTKKKRLISSIQDEQALIDALAFIGHKEIWLEKSTSGELLELYILDGEVLGVLQKASKTDTLTQVETVEITNQVPKEVKKIASKALQAIPGLPHGKVKLLYNEALQEVTVLEIDIRASLKNFLFPDKGKAINIPKKIIDYYFPETKDIDTNKNLYLNLSRMGKLFADGKIEEFKLPTITPDYKQSKLVVTGKISFVNYGSWVRTQARKNHIFGTFKHLTSEQAEIIITGEEENLQRFIEIIKTQNSRDSEVTSVEVFDTSKPLKSGFRLLTPKQDRLRKDGYYPERVEGLSKIVRTPSTKSKEKKPETAPGLKDKSKMSIIRRVFNLLKK